ncbi:hypothetical protein Anapl_05408 [Anas platyrhynchos]|uniref:Uncharacterized protein n=1 Tax=Anas platyrhynchos TaxID=8839 RepID=R0KS73_ANAPL|nr:hypothetical protein Anapl_05408 [Anas platyrhynchos]
MYIERHENEEPKHYGAAREKPWMAEPHSAHTASFTPVQEHLIQLFNFQHHPIVLNGLHQRESRRNRKYFESSRVIAQPLGALTRYPAINLRCCTPRKRSRTGRAHQFIRQLSKHHAACNHADRYDSRLLCRAWTQFTEQLQQCPNSCQTAQKGLSRQKRDGLVLPMQPWGSKLTSIRCTRSTTAPRPPPAPQGSHAGQSPYLQLHKLLLSPSGAGAAPGVYLRLSTRVTTIESRGPLDSQDVLEDISNVISVQRKTGMNKCEIFMYKLGYEAQALGTPLQLGSPTTAAQSKSNFILATEMGQQALISAPSVVLDPTASRNYGHLFNQSHSFAPRLPTFFSPRAKYREKIGKDSVPAARFVCKITGFVTKM